MGIGVWKVGKRWWGAAEAEEGEETSKRGRHFKGGEFQSFPGTYWLYQTGEVE